MIGLCRLPAAGLVVTALLLAAGGCAPRRAPSPRFGELRPPSDFPRDFLLQQRLTFTMGEVERTLQTALQRRGDHLVLVGLTPLGTRAFVVEQRGLEVTATSHLPGDEALPFPPRAVLIDIQRTLLPALEGRPPADGERRGRRGGVTVVERWSAGRLVERRFRRAGAGGGDVIIRYAGGGFRPDEPPGRIEITDERRRSRLVLETLSHRWL